MQKTLKKLLADTSGQDLIEYAIMAGFVAVVAIAIMPEMGEKVSMVALLWGATPHAGLTRIVCAVLAAVFLGIIVFRRKKDAE